MGKLWLQIATPDGETYRAEGLDEVVFRRLERVHEQGSEVAIFPLHGPMLVRVPCSPLRYLRGSEMWHLAIGGGFVEVKGTRILIVTPRFQEIGRDSEETWARAKEVAATWLAEGGDFLQQMTGLAA